MGFFASLSKGWSFMKAAFRMAGQNRKLLAPSVYLVLVTILYFVAWVVGLIAAGADEFSDGTWAVIGAISTLGSFLIFYFFCGMTVNMIDVHLKGGQPSLGEGARDAGKNFIAILFLALVSTVIELFARAARNNDSTVGKILAGIIEAIWTVLSFLLLPAIIIEDASFGQAMRRVRDLHRGNLLLVGIGEVGVRLVTNLIGLVAMALIFGVVYLSITVLGSGTAAVLVAFVAGGTLLALFAALNVYLRMAYYTCLYLWAAEVEKVGATAPAPGPLGVALGHAPVAGAVAV
jgi:hypothetical protein